MCYGSDTDSSMYLGQYFTMLFNSFKKTPVKQINSKDWHISIRDRHPIKETAVTISLSQRFPRNLFRVDILLSVESALL